MKKLSLLEDQIENNGTEESIGEYPKKQLALAKFLKVSPDKITIEYEDSSEYLVEIKGEDRTYRVLEDDEAEAAFKEDIISLIDECGWCLNLPISDYVDVEWFKDAQEERDRSYMEDIESEDDDKFSNRLVQEMYERGIIDDSAFITDEDGEVDYSTLTPEAEDNMDDYKEKFVESLGEDYPDPIEWFEDTFGKEELARAAAEQATLDYDRVVEDVARLDGRGPSLASYDEREEDIEYDGTYFYIYRTN